MTAAELVSLQVGQPRTRHSPAADDNRPAQWTTGFFKAPTDAAVWLGETNLDGDGQADLRVHGGPDKAVNVYPSEHLAQWVQLLGVGDGAPGAFGENFTTAGLLETDVCIGDVYRIGEALVQVSQPRQPCWKLARRWGCPELPARVRSTGKTGWYLRTLEPGHVRRGDAIERVEHPFPRWSIAEANRIMHNPRSPAAECRELAGCPALSADWRAKLLARR
jgi:MOSC domain-containing protein YiiM